MFRPGWRNYRKGLCSLRKGEGTCQCFLCECCWNRDSSSKYKPRQYFLHNLPYLVDRKFGICAIINNGKGMIYDQVQVNDQEDIDKELNREKYRIFYKDFQLTPMGIDFIQKRELHTNRKEMIEGEMNFADLKLGFLEYLINNNKQQIIIDIIMNKVPDYGKVVGGLLTGLEDQTFSFLELERCERGINEIFKLRKSETNFNYDHIHLDTLKEHQQFLHNVLQIYDAIYGILIKVLLML